MRTTSTPKLAFISLMTFFVAQYSFAQNGVGVNTLTPKSSFEDNGSFGKKVSTITSNTTLDETYATVVCNTNAFTVTLPVATGCAFRVYEIKRAIGNTNLITINVTSGGTIDGATTYLLSKAGQSVTIFSDGTIWLLRDGSGEGDDWSLKGNAGTTPGTNFLGTTDAQDMVFKTNNAEFMRIKASNNYLGIGTTNPSFGKIELQVNATNGLEEDDFVIGSHGVNQSPTIIFQNSRGTIASPTRLFYDDYLFSVFSRGRLGASDAAAAYSNALSRIVARYKGDGANSNSVIEFSTTEQPSIIISETGYLGIGRTGTAAVNPSILLHLYENIGTIPSATAATMRLEHNDFGGTSSILFKSKVDGTDFGWISFSDDGSGNGNQNENSLLTISVGNDGAGNYQDDIALMPSGNVGINTIAPTSRLSVNGSADKTGGGGWGTFSDKRLKKDIVDFTDGLDKLMKIHTVKFKYNGKGPYTDSTSEFIGVVAQEIQQVVPYTVSSFKMKLNPSDKVETELLKFDGSSLQYMLINSVKELKNEVDALKKEIETLKKNK